MIAKKIVTSIEKYKGSVYTTVIDDENYYINSSIISEYHLKVGMELSEDELNEIIFANDFRKAKERAFYLLDYRDHSYKELYDKLRRNYSEEVCNAVMEKVCELGFINDEKYAESLARKFFEVKMAGKYKTRFELQKKGISKDIIDNILQRYEDNTQDRIREHIQKKYIRYLTDEKGVQRVYNALVRDGYSYSEIRVALKEINIKDEEKWQ